MGVDESMQRTLISFSTRTGVEEKTPSPVPHTSSFGGGGTGGTGHKVVVR